MKIGKPTGAEDFARLSAVRKALGDGYEIMTDCNQGFAVDEAIRRAGRLGELDLAWIEEPLPADDIEGHVRLSNSTATPIAVGESLYSIRHFREYMARGACIIVQVDVGRIGGITPWLKVAHAAEAFDIPVCPHFLMELHVSLVCAVQNGKYVEYIPQLDDLTGSRMKIADGFALRAPAAGHRHRLGLGCGEGGFGRRVRLDDHGLGNGRQPCSGWEACSASSRRRSPNTSASMPTSGRRCWP